MGILNKVKKGSTKKSFDEKIHKEEISKETKEEFLKSIKTDISAALDDNKSKYEEFLDERMDQAKKDIKSWVDDYLKEKK